MATLAESGKKAARVCQVLINHARVQYDQLFALPEKAN